MISLLIAAILLLVTTISAPVVGDLSILKVMLTNKTDIRHSSVTFGTFGHCILDVPPIQYVLLSNKTVAMRKSMHIQSPQIQQLRYAIMFRCSQTQNID